MGLKPHQVAKYPGLKEEVYIGDFHPDPEILSRLNINGEKPVVLIRPPATEAHYHNPESEVIMQAVLDRIVDDPNVLGVIVPRTSKDGELIAGRLRGASNVRVLTEAVNGLNLIYHADVVVGGGGTMNREAAVLGVPVYSTFMGRIGAIDSMLSGQGRLQFVRAVDDVAKISFAKRDRHAMSGADWKSRSKALVDLIVHEIERVQAL